MFDAIKLWWNTRHTRAKRLAAAATGSVYYGSGNTIHKTGYLDVEMNEGNVVAIWFRCCPLPFKVSQVQSSRAEDMRRMYPLKYVLTGIERSEDSDA